MHRVHLRSFWRNNEPTKRKTKKNRKKTIIDLSSTKKPTKNRKTRSALSANNVATEARPIKKWRRRRANSQPQPSLPKTKRRKGKILLGGPPEEMEVSPKEKTAISKIPSLTQKESTRRINVTSGAIEPKTASLKAAR